MQFSTAIWELMKGKPISNPELRNKVIEVLREHPNYLKPFLKVVEKDKYEEKLSKKLEKQAPKYREEYKKSPNQSGKLDPQLIMLHHASGSYGGAISWILQKISAVSYHMLVRVRGKNGSD